VIETAHRFGGDEHRFRVSGGGGSVGGPSSLYEQVEAYSVFPNDGVRIEPRFIRRVTQGDGCRWMSRRRR